MSASKQTLSTTELLILNSEMSKQEKSLAMAYLMLLAGHLGIHRFYLKKPVSGAIQLALFVVTLISYFMFVIMTGLNATETDSYNLGYSLLFLIPTMLCGLALTVWVIVDACILPGMVKAWNAALEQSLINQIVSFRTDPAVKG